VPPSLSEEISATDRVIELERVNTTLQRQLERAKGKTEDYVDAVYRGARDAAEIVGKANPVTKPERDSRKGSAEYAVLHITDTHFGALTPTFNSDIAEERLRAVVATSMRLTDIQRSHHPVKKCIVALGGDLIENTSVFPGQHWQVDATIFAQVFRAAAAIEAAILGLLGHFDTVDCYEVWGNHARVGRKGVGDYPRTDNWDRIVGEIARERLTQQRRITWHNNDKIWHSVITAGHWSALLIHGDSIRQFGGNTPHAGIQKALNRYAAGVTEPFTDALCGHFHTSMEIPLASGGRAWVTPSLVSGSEFAAEFMGASAKPAQRLLFVSPDRGRVTAEYLVYAEGASA
jgi:hypothetical protein